MTPWLLVVPTALFLFWVLYLAAINVYAAWDNLHWAVRLAGAPVVFGMLAVDALMNITLVALLLWDLPREWLVTSRLQRYRDLARKPDRLTAVADFVCEKALNPFDRTGRHC